MKTTLESAAKKAGNSAILKLKQEIKKKPRKVVKSLADLEFPEPGNEAKEILK